MEFMRPGSGLALCVIHAGPEEFAGFQTADANAPREAISGSNEEWRTLVFFLGARAAGLSF